MNRLGVQPGPRGLVHVATVTLQLPEIRPLEVWRTDEYAGQLTRTHDLLPMTHPLDALPLDGMTKIDRTWIPLVLASDRFLHWRIKYDETDDEIIDSTSEQQMIFYRIPAIQL